MANSPIDKVARLKTACHEAYKAHPRSCSHAVWYVIKKIVDETFQYQQANPLIDMLDKQWTAVDVAAAAQLANQGDVVVGGLKATQNGHVVIVFPGPMKSRGGYIATVRGRPTRIAERGSYPLALSTSMGSWPGAMSDGDKTVWDPWGNDDTFKNVKFWHSGSGTAKVADAVASNTRMILDKANNLA
jgi:hypothetical protein